jgi:hypothetical protein
MKTLKELKTLEGFKEFFDQFEYDDFEFKDYSDHESFCLSISIERDFEYENGDYMIFKIENDLMSVSIERENSIEIYDLSKDQRAYVNKCFDEITEIYKDAEADAREYSRDIYAYHGVRRSDFY